jgi:Tol biopolymer transport system component
MTNGGLGNVFLYDRLSGTSTLVSHVAGVPLAGPLGSSSTLVLSSDGNFIAYASRASGLAPGVDTSLAQNVFLYDWAAGTNVLVSGLAGTAGNRDSFAPVIDARGQFVAFESLADNLVPGQVAGYSGHNVFLYDRLSRANALVSHTSASATVAGSDLSVGPVLSGDGRRVAYTSRATDLVPGFVDGNGSGPGVADGFDVFLYDRGTGSNTLVSRVDDSATASGNVTAVGPVLSADGTLVAFYTHGPTPPMYGSPNRVLEQVYGFTVPRDAAGLVGRVAGTGQ